MSIASGLKRDKPVEMARLTGCKNVVSMRKKFIFNAFNDLKPVQRSDLGALTTQRAREFWISWSWLS